VLDPVGVININEFAYAAEAARTVSMMPFLNFIAPLSVNSSKVRGAIQISHPPRAGIVWLHCIPSTIAKSQILKEVLRRRRVRKANLWEDPLRF
jgi:hypothetical protein